MCGLLQDTPSDRGVADGGQLPPQPPHGVLGVGGRQVGREGAEVLPGRREFGPQQTGEVVEGERAVRAVERGDGRPGIRVDGT
ncbi:hypothetical protein Ssi02_43020 [Sinosporangium siamense]|uniref:Uncharacterized protein n=1 Tax=Sinosporangium siamense TaxID=1367973 RepID=A0A919RHP0_9ACTN|nr:hypothetical protein Ssi02_43020 [Sinosporangium siamense]